jgi:secretion/DNA translocation related TadE-like protein
MRPKDGALKTQALQDHGSGTILALAAVSMAICLFSLSQLVAFNLIAERRLQVTVDAMAIGAADALRGLNTGFPCPTAGEIGLLNGVGLDTCRIVGFEVFISAHLQGVGIVLSANALAGPSY